MAILSGRILSYPRRSRPFLPVAVACFLIGLLVGCQQQTTSVSFDSLCGLARDQFGTMDDQRIEQWGRERFSAALSTIERFDQGHKIVYYSWLPDGIASSVDSRLATISVSQIDKITFEQVVAVLGVPEGVCTEVMRTDATYLDLGLYYPERGLIIWNRDVIQQDAVEVELVGDSQVLYVTCYGQAPRQALECLGLLPQTVDPWPGFGGTVSLHRP